MKKSLSFNAAMSALKTLMSVIFPLITFPYAGISCCLPGWASVPMPCGRVPAM